MPNRSINQAGLRGAGPLLIAILTFTCGQAYATTMQAYSMEDLVAESDLVIIGSAIRIAHQKNTRGKIIRAVTFKVDQYLVGSGPSQIVLELAGGQIGTVRSRVFGEIDLPTNELVLLFVRQSVQPEAHIFYVVGMGQGRFRVVQDGQTGKRFVTQVLGEGLNLVAEIDDDPMGIGRSGVCIFVSLERFVSRIRKILGIREVPAGD